MKRADADGRVTAGRTIGPREHTADFGLDTRPLTTRQIAARQLRSLRRGDLGPLPALLGLAVLIVLFTVLDSGGTFLSLLNLANLFEQGAGGTVIAMGLVFVLLTGEIDLAAGTASGLTSSIMALHLVSGGDLQKGMGYPIFILFAAAGVVAMVLAASLRMWLTCALSGAFLALLFAAPVNTWMQILLAVTAGIVIGCITGFLVARLRMPSFVVTLALFITWQGAILLLVGDGGTLGLRGPVFADVANGNLSPLGSWLLFAAGAGGYTLVQIGRQISRRRQGLVSRPWSLVGMKVMLLVVLAAIGTYLMTVNRSPGVFPIAGIPYVVPLVLALLVFGTYVLNRTQFGRHVYAVGGNREAARRAGIDVARIRASVFVVSSAFAAIGGIIYSSKVGSVSPSAGGGNTLLFAVGAAVIGGTSLFGGRGRIGNAVIGGAVLATVTNGLGLLKQSSAVVFVVTGAVLLLAAAVDAFSRRHSAVGLD
jgi:D-xylose transport system permease protein